MSTMRPLGDRLASARADLVLDLDTLGTSLLFLGATTAVDVDLSVTRRDRFEAVR